MDNASPNSPAPTPPQSSVPISVWQLKPWWCQPWSILLTGVTLIGGSWLLLHWLWLTLLVAIPVGVWMIFFVVIYPQQMAASGLLESYAAKAGAPESAP